MPDKMDPASIQAFQRDFGALRDRMETVIVGCEDVIENLLICFFSGGNLLIDSAPGLGKTLIAKTLAHVMELHSSRIQFTPDLMPADIIGTTIVQETTDGRKHFVFQKGPVFTQLLLADEINRATPKTQSALLEAMQERHVSAGGKTYDLERPYFVIATMNSHETGGTYALPEAQVDRFLFKLTLGRPDIDHLQEISRRWGGSAMEKLAPVIDGKRAEEMKALVLAVEAPHELRRFAIGLVLRTNPSSKEAVEKARKYIRYGSSPRGVQALILGAKVRALVAGRDTAGHEDVLAVARPALAHRLILNFEGEADGVRTEDLIDEVVRDLTAAGQPQTV
ncbi:MAG: AAA family ATPase [Phycisphaerae bacterium]